MEDHSQRMEALKKAYAEIILNTAKEAAARIMVSERRALLLQRDLFAAKDDALRTILRFKNLMDSKITEAKITSLSQRRRIEELEAQLHEAEQIITDLRTELREVQDELKLKNNQGKPLNGQISEEDAPSRDNTTDETKLNICEPVIFPLSNSGPRVVTSCDMNTAPFSQTTLENRCCSATTKQTILSSDSNMDNNYPDNPDLASLIMRSKKPQQYRNGCTQRIRAFERNLLDGKLPSGHVDDQLSLMKDESIITVDEKGDGTCAVASPKATNMDMIKKPNENQPVKVTRRRKRKIRYGNARKASRTSCPRQPMKPSQPSSLLSRFKTFLDSVGDNVKTSGVCTVPPAKDDNREMTKGSTMLGEKSRQNSNGCEDQAVKIVPKGFRKRKVKYRGTIATSFRSVPVQLTKSCASSCVLSHCKTYSHSVNGKVKSGDEMLEMTGEEVEMKPFPHLDPEVNASGVENVTDKDEELIDNSATVKHIDDSAESLRVPNCTMNLEMDDVQLTSPDPKDAKASEANNEAPSRADTDRLLKYTFCRKRKKESLTLHQENTSLEKSSMKMRAEEIPSGSPEPERPNLINESSRDSRRLFQVARQLISLSGKRWG